MSSVPLLGRETSPEEELLSSREKILPEGHSTSVRKEKKKSTATILFPLSRKRKEKNTVLLHQVLNSNTETPPSVVHRGERKKRSRSNYDKKGKPPASTEGQDMGKSRQKKGGSPRFGGKPSTAEKKVAVNLISLTRQEEEKGERHHSSTTRRGRL